MSGKLILYKWLIFGFPGGASEPGSPAAMDKAEGAEGPFREAALCASGPMFDGWGAQAWWRIKFLAWCARRRVSPLNLLQEYNVRNRVPYPAFEGVNNETVSEQPAGRSLRSSRATDEGRPCTD